MSSGIYMLRTGPFFYIGSSTDFKKRRYTHKSGLINDRHFNRRIQAAFNNIGVAEFTPLKYIRPNKKEDTKAFSKRLKESEQIALDQHKDDPNLCNVSGNAFGPDNGEMLKEKWRDDAYRKKMSEALKGREVSDVTRLKMSEAKKGKSNPKSKAIIITDPKGATMRFSSATEAAAFFSVSQQLFDQWIRGVVAWPGTGRRTLKRNEWIIGYSARYEI